MNAMAGPGRARALRGSSTVRASREIRIPAEHFATAEERAGGQSDDRQQSGTHTRDAAGNVSAPKRERARGRSLPPGPVDAVQFARRHA